MNNFDKIYLSKFDMDLDPAYAEEEDFIDIDFRTDLDTSQFIDEDINELEDLLWKE
jgi:hypothetical protein